MWLAKCISHFRLRSCRPMAFSTSLSQHDDYCREHTKNFEYDSYLSGLLLPLEQRPAYFAIRAFNIEIANIKDNVRGNAAAGRVRFQWWEDTFDKIFSSIQSSTTHTLKFQHPVADALNCCIRKHNLSYKWLSRSLQARKQDMYISEVDSLDSLETYAEEGHSSLVYLQLELLGINKEEVKYMASHVGVGYGLTTALRGIPHNVMHNSQYIPREVLKKHGVAVNTALGKPADPDQKKRLQDAIYDVASQAYAHLDKAKELFAANRNLKGTKYILFPAVSSFAYLEELRKADFNPFAPDLIDRPPGVTLRYQMNLLKMKTFGSLN